MIEIFRKLNNIERMLFAKENTFNIDGCCTLTGLSKSTIYKLTMSGDIPHYKQAKHLYFDREEVEAWLKSNRGVNVKEV